MAVNIDETLELLRMAQVRVSIASSDIDDAAGYVDALVDEFKCVYQELEETKAQLQKLRAIYDRWLLLPEEQETHHTA